MINPCISLRFFMICVSHNWHPEWYLVTIDLTSLSEQAEMKVTNSLQQPYSFSLAPTRLLSCWRLATQQFASPTQKVHWFSKQLFLISFPRKLVQYPKNISIWHTHVYPFLIQICGFHCTTLTQIYRCCGAAWPLNCIYKFDQNHSLDPPQPTRGYHGSKFTVCRFSFGDGSLANLMWRDAK